MIRAAIVARGPKHALQIVFCFLMVLSGPCGCANAPHAAVRARFQGEFLDSSFDLGVDRLALLRSWVPGLIAINEVTSQPVFSDAAQEVAVPQSCLSRASVSKVCWIYLAAPRVVLSGSRSDLRSASSTAGQMQRCRA